MNQPLTPAGAVAARPRNRYDRMEWAGAFGDLGTLIPFVAAYIGVVGMDPTGVLLAFGIAMVASGLWYRTPVPVQPPDVAAPVERTGVDPAALPELDPDSDLDHLDAR